MRQVTRENLKKLMAIILFEKGKGEAISVATIQGEFGSRFQITGTSRPVETNNLALLLRAGSLAAPMEIIEERTVGPSLGKENIEQRLEGHHVGLHRHRRLHVAVLLAVRRHLVGRAGLNLLFLWRCCRCCRPR